MKGKAPPAGVHFGYARGKTKKRKKKSGTDDKKNRREIGTCHQKKHPQGCLG